MEIKGIDQLDGNTVHVYIHNAVVVVRAQDEGISVYLYPSDLSQDCIAETWALYSEFDSDNA